MIAVPAGFRLQHLGRVDSTNAEALRAAASGAPGGLVVLADRQERGRGRQGRSWFSDGGSLTFSVLLRPRIPPADAPLVPLLAGVAVVEALPEVSGLWLKWPNDLWIGRRKVGGILCELETRGDAVAAIVVGIGLNLAEPAGGWPEGLSAAALDAGDRGVVLARVLAALAEREQRLLRGGRAQLLARVHELMFPMLGGRVRIQPGGAPWSGTVEGLDERGALVVCDDAGQRRAVLAGDVHLLPP